MITVFRRRERQEEWGARPRESVTVKPLQCG